MSVLGKEKRIEILAHLVEGTGIRSTARLCGTSRATVGKLSLDLGEGCAALHDDLMRDLRVALVQVDEQWSFVKKKQKRLNESDDAETMGDQWTYAAVDVVHRAVISFLVGKRTAATARAFITDLRSRIRGRFQATADGYKPYADAFVEICGDTVDFAQLVKRYECDEREARGFPLGRKRYTGSEHVIITGNPELRAISTSRIERTNLSNRMEQARFARKTLRHSKALRQHRAATALYYAHFNLCRVHQSLDTTPAVALGVTPREWSPGELIEAAFDLRPRGEIVEREPPTPDLQPRLRILKGGRS
jgi:IS1 family transposase